MSTLDEINEDWQVNGLSPTWAKLQQAKQEQAELIAERDALKAEVLKLHQSLAQSVLHAEQGWSRYENANRLASGYMAELERIKSLPPVAWRSSMGHGVTLKESITDEQKALVWDGKPMWQPLIALGSKT